MRFKDLVAYWRLRRIVARPWHVLRLRGDKSSRMHAVLLANGHCVHLRGGTADMRCFGRIFGQDEYRLSHAARAGRLDTVVDVGAQIGLFSIRVAVIARRVVALEPVEANFQLLCRNVEGLQNVTPIKAAAAERDGTVRIAISDKTDAHSLYGASDGPAETAPGLTMSGLFASQAIERVSLLKLDCEGAEYVWLYDAPLETLARVDAIVLEYHPGVRPRDDGEQLAMHLRRAGFQVRVRPSRRTRGMGLMFCERPTGVPRTHSH